ncbi:S8 family serine peptidase [Nonomuraea sp. NPDC003709]|uniref:S8 family serine peptidase n=1 Tax=Nonomuraea sp. NPDC003709 TaxID=3154450 RepID=UPI0033AAEC0F
MSLGSGLMAAALAGTVGLAAVQQPVPGDSGSAAQEAGSVTLLTGDRVVVTGRGHRVEPGPGREARYFTQYRDGHLHVIPSDAMPLVAAGVLDRRLFDVTQLLRWRLGDADRADIPLITQTGADPASPLKAAQQTVRLAALGMTALRLPKKGAGESWKDLISRSRTQAAGKTRIWLDGRRSFTLDQSVKQIGATEAWKQGITGEGVTVAVLDSGYDPDHPDLKNVVTQARSFTGDSDPRDTFGHGTHVASIIAGAGEKYRGVAPGARLAVGKVGDAEGITDSALLAGMEWAATEVKAKIINMSIGGGDTPDLDPLEQAVNTLSARTGALFVVSAGNNGGPVTVSSPGSADAALTVGAVDRTDQLAGFSSRGPRMGDHAIKPEITAPGVGITAAAVGGGYIAHNGTSMAAPHVAGAAAILAQRHPGWTGERLKAALIGSAASTPTATPFEQGGGRVDLVRALAQPVVAAPGTAWAAFRWDDAGGRRTTRTLTYANSGDSPVTLDLTVTGDVLKLPADRLQVPAGGEAQVTLTIDAEGKSVGEHTGVVTATSGDTVIRTLAGAYVEPESSDVTVTGINRSGLPAAGFGDFYNLDTGSFQSVRIENGVAKVRLPKGRWNLYADLYEGSAATTAHVPVTIGDDDQNVVLDARQAKQIRFAVDDPTAVPEQIQGLTLANGTWYFGWIAVGDPGRSFFVLPVRQPELRYMTNTIWHKKDTSPSPYRYDLVDYRVGGIPDDPAYTARTADLVKVSETYRASGVPGQGVAATGPRMPGMDWAFTVPSPAVDLPGAMTNYRTPGFVWDSELRTGTATLTGTSGRLDRGPVREVWNAAVTGPGFAAGGGERTGNELNVSAAQLFSDGAAGRRGADAAATGALTLARNGEVIAKADVTGCAPAEPGKCLLSARLPEAADTYTLTASVRRQAPHAALTTAVDTIWTFRSAGTAKPSPLPLMAVRYAPAGLDDSNRARPGSVTRVPVWVERNPGAAKAAVRSLTLEMSADDGATWRRIRVTPGGTSWTALLSNPRTPGFVSLRATATDSAGDRVTQTISRAYSVG